MPSSSLCTSLVQKIGFNLSETDLQDERDLKVIVGFRSLCRTLRDLSTPTWVAWRPDDWEEELRRRQTAAQGGANLRPTTLDDPLFVVWSIINTWQEVFRSKLPREIFDSLHKLRLCRNRAIHPGHADGPISEQDFKDFERRCSQVALEFTQVFGKSSPKSSSNATEMTVTQIAQPKLEIVPIYILADRSDSMSGEAINAVNTGLVNAFRFLASDPLVSSRCRVSVLQFNQRCQLILSLSAFADAASIPELEAYGTTNWGEALRELRRVSSADRQSAAGSSYTMLRPLVFMFSDGAPLDDDWHREWVATTDPTSPIAPVMFFYGVGSVPVEMFSSIAAIAGMGVERVRNLAGTSSIAEHIERALGSMMGSICLTMQDPELTVAVR